MVERGRDRRHTGAQAAERVGELIHRAQISRRKGCGFACSGIELEAAMNIFGVHCVIAADPGQNSKPDTNFQQTCGPQLVERAADAGDAVGNFDFIFGRSGKLFNTAHDVTGFQVEHGFAHSIAAGVHRGQLVDAQSGVFPNANDILLGFGRVRILHRRNRCGSARGDQASSIAQHEIDVRTFFGLSLDYRAGPQSISHLKLLPNIVAGREPRNHHVIDPERPRVGASWRRPIEVDDNRPVEPRAGSIPGAARPPPWSSSPARCCSGKARRCRSCCRRRS